MHIILNHSSMVPIYEQLMEQIKNEILTGQAQADTPLPSVRALAGELRISALTVKKAYDRLEQEGYIVTVHGKGSYVAKADKELAMEARRKEIEACFLEVISKAKAIGMNKEEIKTIFEIMLEDE